MGEDPMALDTLAPTTERRIAVCRWCRKPYDDVGEACQCRPVERILVPDPTRAELVAEVARLRAALQWYGNQNRYRVGAWPERDDDPSYDGSILPDGGRRARRALAGLDPDE